MSTYHQEAGGTSTSIQQYQMMSAAAERSNLNRQDELYVFLRLDHFSLNLQGI
jgi:hypothetical protein